MQGQAGGRDGRAPCLRMLRPDRGSRAQQEQRPARTARRQASAPASPDFSASQGSVRARSPQSPFSVRQQPKQKQKRRILLCAWESSSGFFPVLRSPETRPGTPVPTRPEPPFTLVTTASSPLSSKREAGGFPPGWKIQPRAFYLLCRSSRSDILRMTSGSPVTASSESDGCPLRDNLAGFPALWSCC